MHVERAAPSRDRVHPVEYPFRVSPSRDSSDRATFNLVGFLNSQKKTNPVSSPYLRSARGKSPCDIFIYRAIVRTSFSASSRNREIVKSWRTGPKRFLSANFLTRDVSSSRRNRNRNVNSRIPCVAWQMSRFPRMWISRRVDSTRIFNYQRWYVYTGVVYDDIIYQLHVGSSLISEVSRIT